MRVVRIILSLVALLSFAGCVKFDSECEFIIKPRWLPVSMNEQSSPDNPAYMVRVYAFYNVGKNPSEAERWRPRSFAQAEAGIIHHRTSDQRHSYSLVGEQGDDKLVHLTMTSSPVVLVAVDPLNRFYAYGVFEYGIPMPQLEIVLRIDHTAHQGVVGQRAL